MSGYTFLFPGQGAQYVGMGQDLCAEFPVARALYDEANELLGYDLRGLCFEGPAERLQLTQHAQPALLVHSLACHAVFHELTDGRITPTAVAGHSVGEYPALVVAGALSFADALRLVQARGEAMNAHGAGKMVALAMTMAEAEPVAAAHFCDLAVSNLPRQTVVGGRAEDVDGLREALEAEGRSPGVLLDTAGAFHTHLMVAAALAFRPHLDAARFKPVSAKALSNQSGTYHDPEPGAIRAQLFYQVFRPVRWVACMDQVIADGHTLFVELGGGLGGAPGVPPKRARLQQMTRKLLRGAKAEGVHHPAMTAATIKAAAEALG